MALVTGSRILPGLSSAAWECTQILSLELVRIQSVAKNPNPLMRIPSSLLNSYLFMCLYSSPVFVDPLRPTLISLFELVE